MKNSWTFKTPEGVALFVEDCLNQGVDSVLIQTTPLTPLGDCYVLTVTGNLDGTTQPLGCEKPQTTSTDRPLVKKPYHTEILLEGY